MTIVFKVPASFLPERVYIADVVFREFLGISYRIDQSPGLKDKYIIQVGDKSIEFEDAFFSNIEEKADYLSADLIPSKVFNSAHEFLFEKDIPVLFGSGKMEKSDGFIQCGHDLFASIFFMLTRWEESVIDDKDYLDRFPAQSALTYKFNLLHRPLVNEWVEMLKNMLQFLEPGIEFSPPQSFEVVFTHDIDLLNAPVTIKEFAKDIFKRKRLGALFKRLRYLIKGSNPYDLFDYFMDASEKHKTLSRFYFMTGHNLAGRDGEPYNHTPLYPKVLKKIKERGHIIGFHPSLFSYNDPVMFAKEKLLLEKDIGCPVTEGRQHALRFVLPGTWNIWEDNNMQIDSTLGYSAHEGFRCGTGNIYTTFDVKKRRQLQLKEMPLVFMDNTLHVNRKLSIIEAKQIVRQYIDTGKKYNMPITLLFHNLIDDVIDWKNWKQLYDDFFANTTEL